MADTNLKSYTDIAYHNKELKSLNSVKAEQPHKMLAGQLHIMHHPCYICKFGVVCRVFLASPNGKLLFRCHLTFLQILIL